MARPRNPISAVTNRNPYGYYASLAAERPLAFDPALGMWVAASAEAVSAVLHDPRCRVRPLAEPVPEALRWTAMDDIYSRWARMNDGPGHDAPKQAISAALASIAPREVELRSRTWAAHLLGTRPILLGLPFTLPTFVIGSLLGIPDAYLANTSIFLDQVVCWLAGRRGIEAEAGVALETLGDLAATDLRMTLSWQLKKDEQDGHATLLTELARQMRAVDIDDRATIVANAIGFLFQAYEATAGLIGNTLMALARDPNLRAPLVAEPGLIEQCVVETAVADPAIQNTRRYVAEGGIIAGRPMQTGDTILVLLAAANSDPALNADRARGDAAGRLPHGFSFGAGPHVCPGAALALTIARTGVEALLARGDDRWLEAGAATYRPSINARVPRFTEEFQ